MNATRTEPVSARLTAVDVDAVPVRWYRAVTAQQAAARPTLLWLHGGGFFRGSIDQPEAHAVAEALARDGVTVATVGYRLAPPPGMPWVTTNAGRARGRYPSQLDDVMHAYREIGSRSPGGVVLGGASAGACLAASTALRAMDEGARPVGTVLVYGFFHARNPGSATGGSGLEVTAGSPTRPGRWIWPTGTTRARPGRSRSASPFPEATPSEHFRGL